MIFKDAGAIAFPQKGDIITYQFSGQGQARADYLEVVLVVRKTDFLGPRNWRGDEKDIDTGAGSPMATRGTIVYGSHGGGPGFV